MMNWEGCESVELWPVLKFNPAFSGQGLRKTTKSPGIFGVPAKIQTRYFSNTSQEHYHLSQLAWWCYQDKLLYALRKKCFWLSDKPRMHFFFHLLVTGEIAPSLNGPNR
jgi:hypothetical protein